VTKITDFQLFFQKGTCTSCKKDTFIIHRKHSGDKLCSTCFTRSIEKIIYKTISKYKMLNPSDKIIVGVSGGKDSLTLLHNLIKIQEKNYQAEPLIALSINEGINNYRNNSIKNASEFCKKHKIEHHAFSFKEKIGITLDEINKTKKKTDNFRYTCNYCAVLRRRLINDGAKELGGDVIALGHNLTDIAETYLMNLLFNRFHLISNQYFFKPEQAEINKYFLKKINPLMKIPEEEIFLYANINQIDYYASHCPFREQDPILRKRVLHFIEECKQFSPEIEFNLLNGFLKLSKILYGQVKPRKFNSCEQCGYPSGNNTLCNYCQYVNKFNQ